MALFTCADAPCANGATCVDEAEGFRCVCDAGSAGPLCESILECSTDVDCDLANPASPSVATDCTPADETGCDAANGEVCVADGVGATYCVLADDGAIACSAIDATLTTVTIDGDVICVADTASSCLDGRCSEGLGLGEGEGEAGDGGRGDVCAGDVDCVPDHACGTMFADPNVPKACMPSCVQVGGTCAVTAGVSGSCMLLSGMTRAVCIADSPLMGLCGNGASARCAADVACGLAPSDNPSTPVNDSIVGFCIVPCAANGTCASGALACSDDFRVTTTAGTVGVCVPPTDIGETCGPTANAVVLCTGDQTCEQGASGLTCAADSG